MDAIEISNDLRRRYFLQLIPAVILMGLLYFFADQLKWQGNGPDPGNLINDILVGLAAVIGIALPIFFRSYFVFKIRDKMEISKDIFVRFEKIQITFALITPYFLVFSIAFDKTNKANVFITILALYAAYYYFPSLKKVKYEMKIFRIKASESNTKS